MNKYLCGCVQPAMTDRGKRELLDEMEYTRSRMQHATKVYLTVDELVYLVGLVNRDVFGESAPTPGKGESTGTSEASQLTVDPGGTLEPPGVDPQEQIRRKADDLVKWVFQPPGKEPDDLHLSVPSAAGDRGGRAADGAYSDPDFGVADHQGERPAGRRGRRGRF